MQKFDFRSIYWMAPWKISFTWAWVVVENMLLALLPLLTGHAIDGLLQGETTELMRLAAVVLALIVLATSRRIYDTRLYAGLREKMGLYVDQAHQEASISARNARLDMSDELIEFMEIKLPEVLTAFVQVTMALVILYGFYLYLSLSAMVTAMLIGVIYAFFHGSFYQLNKRLNHQHERQVMYVERNKLARYLFLLKHLEIRLSDREAILYGIVFLILMFFLLGNLWMSAQLPNITAGKIFSIISYSWEFIDAILVLPMTLQNLSRLTEIKHRLNAEDII